MSFGFDEDRLGEWVAVRGGVGGDTLRYQVVWAPTPDRAELGHGGIGRVLRAFDDRLGREVALKELLPLPAGADVARVEERFLREARIAARLEHPNVIPIYDVGRFPDGRPFFTMKLVRGRTLSAALDACPTLLERLLLLPHVVDVGRAVEHAHGRGVIHCDLKPDNVMIGEHGETVLLDWGLARVPGLEPVPGEVAGAKLLRSAALTRGPLAVRGLGTPAYLSPEQAAGRVGEIDERTDVWGLGALLYEVLTGWPPYHASSPDAALASVLQRAAVPVDRLAPLAPGGLVAAAQRALRREPRCRFATARQFVAEVEGFLPVPVRESGGTHGLPVPPGGNAIPPGRFTLPAEADPDSSYARA